MYIVGIAGGSGSGKTTFVEKIRKKLSNRPVAVIHLDSYYHSEPDPVLSINEEHNFDHPQAFDWDLLKQHIREMKMGRSVEIPQYDFSESRRKSETTNLAPCQTILLEGIFALWDETIRSMMDLKVFLHVDADIRFIRRLHRDIQERSRTIESMIRQYYETVRPMHYEFLEPTQKYADLIVGEETDKAADVVAAKVRDVMDHSR